MVTTQTADNVLKSYYLDVVSDQLNKTINPLFAAIKQTSSDVWGRDVRKAVRVGIDGGIGAGTEDGDLPKAGGATYAQFVSTLKNLYGTIEITDKAIRASANNEGAFVNLLNDAMEELVKSSSYNLGRMLFGDGSGKLCMCVDVHETDKTTFKVDTVQNVYEGMRVDLVNANGKPHEQAVTVLAVDRDNKYVKLDCKPYDSTNNYALYIQGSRNLEITGIKALFDSANLYGVSRESNPWLNPVSVAVDGEITEDAILTAMDEVEARSGGRPNFIVCSWGVRRALYKLLSTNKRCETLELEGGFRAISFNGIPVIADRFCPANTMYLLNTDDFALHQLGDWQWLEGEDGKVLKQIAGKAAYTATLVKYAELMCYRPCGQARLTGITEG